MGVNVHQSDHPSRHQIVRNYSTSGKRPFKPMDAVQQYLPRTECYSSTLGGPERGGTLLVRDGWIHSVAKMERTDEYQRSSF